MSYVDQIAQAMRDVGNARARGVAANGEAWGGAVADMGALASHAYQQQQAQQIAAQEAQLRAAQLAESQQRTSLEGAAGQRAAATFGDEQKAAFGQELGNRLMAIRNAPDQVKPTLWQAFKARAASAPKDFQFEAPDTVPSNETIDAEVESLLGKEKQVIVPGVGLVGERSQRVYTPEPIKILERDPSKDLINGGTGAMIAPGTPAAPKMPNSQESDFLVDGKAVKGDYIPGVNGQPGKYFYQGKDVTGKAGKIPAASSMGTPATSSDVKESIAGMKDGTIPPQLPGRASKDFTAIMAEAHRQGYDLQGAVTDWNATQKHVATMNGAQQLRLNQSVNALPDMLDSVDALAQKWNAGRFPILNKANLALAKNGAFGRDAATIANQLDSQIADVTADLGNVYMGGNSPTDHALELAGKSLSANWDGKVLREMVGLARKNVAIRQNSIKNTGVAGASANNPYAPATAPTPITKPIPGIPGAEATSTDGGRTWKRTK